ncbi:MAG: hypothetical protein GC200_10280 [Tepidisphaera sp.]|nr:hypothetical protein [Tepidisphaera sp.]
MKTSSVVRAAVLAAGVASIGGLAQAQDYNINLIANPGAEEGPASPNGNTIVMIPNWDTLDDGFTVVAYGTAGFPAAFSGSGQKFFVGGNNAQFSTASQTIDLTPLAQGLDTGAVTFQLAADLGGAGNQDDNASITLLWADGAGNSIGTSGLQGPLAGERGNQTKLLHRMTMGTVPAGARSVTLVLFMARNVGPFNDASADNVSLVLSRPPCNPDINDDGVADQGDVDYLINVIAGGGNPNNADPDFNNDGVGDQGDVDALINVIAGGACP